MTSPKVEVLPIEQGATPDQANANKHTQRGSALVENSLRRRGAFRSIASAGKNTEIPVVYAGNLTLEKAVEAGFKRIINVHTTGGDLVNVVRDDVAPGSPEAVALGLEDNESAKQSYSPDLDIVAALAAGDDAVLSALRREDKVFGGMLEGMGLVEFHPSLSPTMTGKVYTQEDIDAIKNGDKTIKLKDLMEVICPDCGHVFFVDPRANQAYGKK